MPRWTDLFIFKWCNSCTSFDEIIIHVCAAHDFRTRIPTHAGATALTHPPHIRAPAPGGITFPQKWFSPPAMAEATDTSPKSSFTFFGQSAEQPAEQPLEQLAEQLPEQPADQPADELPRDPPPPPRDPSRDPPREPPRDPQPDAPRMLPPARFEIPAAAPAAAAKHPGGLGSECGLLQSLCRVRVQGDRHHRGQQVRADEGLRRPA